MPSILGGGIIQKDSNCIKEYVCVANTYKLITFVQYALWIALSFIIVEAIVTSGYHTILFTLAVGISFSAAALTLGLLAFKLFFWYKRVAERGAKLVMLSYGFAAVLTTVGCLVIVGYNLPIIYQEEGAWVEGVATTTTTTTAKDEEDAVSNGGAISTITIPLLGLPYVPLRIAYFFLWIASAVLLKYHSKRIGKLRYWTIISLPLLSFLVGSAYVSTIEDTSTSFFSAVVIQISVVSGSLLFAMAFFTISKSLSQSNQVSMYLRISGYGVLLLALSLLPGVIYAPFPLSGLASWTTLALASFLYSIGIYSSAVSVSYDTTLRKLLRSLYVKQEEAHKREQASLLKSIGTAELQQNIQKKVLRVVREQEDSIRHQYAGVESSLTENDMREYMERINKELKRRR